MRNDKENVIVDKTIDFSLEIVNIAFLNTIRNM
jgi:hypothetical protein